MKHANDHILWSDFSAAVQQIRLHKQNVEKNNPAASQTHPNTLVQWSPHALALHTLCGIRQSTIKYMLLWLCHKDIHPSWYSFGDLYLLKAFNCQRFWDWILTIRFDVPLSPHQLKEGEKKPTKTQNRLHASSLWFEWLCYDDLICFSCFAEQFK